MPTYFEISKMEQGYTWQDFELMDIGVEYATDVLEIPEEYLESVISVYGEKIEVSLLESKEYLHEEWYYLLLPYAA